MEIGDVWFVGGALGFFALCVAYVRGLDRLVCSGEEADATPEAVTPEAVTS